MRHFLTYVLFLLAIPLQLQAVVYSNARCALPVEMVESVEEVQEVEDHQQCASAKVCPFDKLRAGECATIGTAPSVPYVVVNDYGAQANNIRGENLNHSSLITHHSSFCYVWDGWKLAAEIEKNPAGTIIGVRHFIYGPDIEGQKIASLDSEAEGIGGLILIREWKTGIGEHIYLPLSDALGNICGLIDGSSGNLVAEYEYSPYGQLIMESGPAIASCPFRHRTRYYDKENWLYYYGHRYYDPATTKWISKDPLGEAGGWNLTAFCDDDPVNKYDPIGLDYMPVLKTGDGGRIVGLAYMQYIAPVGKPGTGYSLSRFDNFKRLGMIEGDAFDQRFENVLRGASAPYRFGDLSEGELIEAINRGYVNEWDYPLLAGRDPWGDWAVGMSGREVIEGAVMQVGFALAGQGISMFCKLFRPSAAILAAPRSIAYRAIDPKYAQSTLDDGFYRSGAAGRLGNDGIYANSSVKGAISEFQYHNPNVTPNVFEVKYTSGTILKIDPPLGNFYIESPLPFTQDVNILSAPSLRQMGTINYLIREGAVPGRIVQ